MYLQCLFDCYSKKIVLPSIFLRQHLCLSEVFKYFPSVGFVSLILGIIFYCFLFLNRIFSVIDCCLNIWRVLNFLTFNTLILKSLYWFLLFLKLPLEFSIHIIIKSRKLSMFLLFQFFSLKLLSLFLLFRIITLIQPYISMDRIVALFLILVLLLYCFLVCQMLVLLLRHINFITVRKSP